MVMTGTCRRPPDELSAPGLPAASARRLASIDELAALYAEGYENTEREPFTVTEAVEHRRRIRDAGERAARERGRRPSAPL